MTTSLCVRSIKNTYKHILMDNNPFVNKIMTYCPFVFVRQEGFMIFERVKTLVNQKGMTIAELERKLDFGQGTINKWKNQSPSSERLKIVADYFDVSTDYLLGREEKVSLAEKYGVFAFDGEPVTDDEVQFLLSVLEAKRNADNK